jgi:hypothetical protein
MGYGDYKLEKSEYTIVFSSGGVLELAGSYDESHSQ